MKRNRLGLGVDDEIGPQMKFAKTKSNSTVLVPDDTIKAYQSYQRDRFRESKTNGQLKASVAICLTLDSARDITDNPLLPSQFLPKDETAVEELDRPILEATPLSVSNGDKTLRVFDI